MDKHYYFANCCTCSYGLNILSELSTYHGSLDRIHGHHWNRRLLLPIRSVGPQQNDQRPHLFFQKRVCPDSLRDRNVFSPILPVK